MTSSLPPPIADVDAVVDAFLADVCEATSGATFTSTAELVAAARHWCDEREEFRFGARALAKALHQRGLQRHSTGVKRGWRGVRLK